MAILLIDLILIEDAHGLSARHASTRAVVDRVAALVRARHRSQDVAIVAIAPGDEHRVAVLLPDGAGERWMTAGKCPCRALAMDPHLAEVGMVLGLHEVVADLVDELQIGLEHA